MLPESIQLYIYALRSPATLSYYAYVKKDYIDIHDDAICDCFAIGDTPESRCVSVLQRKFLIN
jgi:hypothetical protein